MSEETNPKQLEKQGQAAYKKKDFAAAADLFQEAARQFAVQGEALQAAQMANNWSVAALQAEDVNTAIAAVEGTPEIFLEENDIGRAGMAYGNLGSAQEAAGLLDEALISYERSASLLKEAGDHDTRLHVMQALSALQLRTGKQLQALATMQAGLEGGSKLSPKQQFLKKMLKLPNRFMSGE